MENVRNVNNLYSEYKKRVVLTMRHLLTQDDFVNNNLNQAGFISIVDGEGKLVFQDGEEILLGPRDCVMYDCDKPFTLTFTTATEFFALNFSFNDLIDEQYMLFTKEKVGAFLSFLSECCDKVNGLHVNASRIQETLFLIENELDNRNDCSEFVVKSYMAVVLSLTMQYFFVDFTNVKEERSAHYKDIEKSIVYIHENISEKITLEELAKIAMMGKTNYSVCFKKMTGMTVWEYILNARIELASSYLLEKGDAYNITDLAFQCGFNNSAYFNKTFKKLKGKTPSDFKKDSGNPCF